MNRIIYVLIATWIFATVTTNSATAVEGDWQASILRAWNIGGSESIRVPYVGAAGTAYMPGEKFYNVPFIGCSVRANNGKSETMFGMARFPTDGSELRREEIVLIGVKSLITGDSWEGLCR
jgi:hypothetical protein